MSDTRKEELSYRIATALLGGLCAIFYGFAIAILTALCSGKFYGTIIGWTVAVFTIVGYFYGNVIWEVFSALLHFLYGFLSGLAKDEYFEPDRETSSHLRAISVIGFLTAIILVVALYVI